MGSYKPTKERLRKAREILMSIPDRGSDEDYARVVEEEHSDLLKAITPVTGGDGQTLDVVDAVDVLNSIILEYANKSARLSILMTVSHGAEIDAEMKSEISELDKRMSALIKAVEKLGGEASF